MCMLFAATYPDRTTALALYGTFARAAWAPDYTWARTDREAEARPAAMKEPWGTGASALTFAPSAAADPVFREWCAGYERQDASPGAIEALMRMNREIDAPAPSTSSFPATIICRSSWTRIASSMRSRRS